MTFREILTGIVDGTPGALAGAIMGADGIAIEEYERTESSVELTAVAIEFQRVLEQARKVAGAIYRNGDGERGLEELILVTAEHQLYFREIDEEYFMVVALDPTGVLGKARYDVRNALDELRTQL
jgi:predicted regulator of Ras-like GTPase activity (Roadblock/LC7/MglB family)